VCLQLFTKQPSRWAEPDITNERRAAFLSAREAHRIRVIAAHDAYLINLASPDPVLRERSYRSFEDELRRCTVLGIELLVTHPGNATDGDYASGIVRNGESIARALETVGGETRVLLELTSGGGSSLGGSFEDLAAITEVIPPPLRARMGVCVDTCHAWSSGYDLEGEYEAVWREFDDRLGLERLQLFHFNDSKTPFASHRDRHEHIGKGSLGLEPFRKLLLDDRFHRVPKLLETPKGRDAVKADRKNLRVLRALRREG
jgi:deoxyribonuclease-4